MKVTSPIGEMPFTADRARLTRHGVIIEGSMGAWPAKVTVSAADTPQLLRVALVPLLILAVVMAAVITAIVAIS